MRSRGFTIIELLIAAAIAAAMAATAFAVVLQIQSTSGDQARAAAAAAAARSALETMGRDLRNAGDSHNFLSSHCIAGRQHPAALGLCPAIFEPHPWRVILTRNAWVAGALGTGVVFEANDAPRVGLPLNAGAGAENSVVAYEFVPLLPVAQAYTDLSTRPTGAAGPPLARQAWVGRIERIYNPWSWNGVAARREVLLTNVILDDGMIADPTDPDGDAFDRTFDFTLFTYHVLGTVNGGLAELAGAPARVGGPARQPRLGALLSPPLRFFQPGPPRAILDPLLVASPHAGTYPADIVGLVDANGTASADLVATTPVNGAEVDLQNPTSDLRFLLDRNRIRAVRITFKVFEEWDPVRNRPVEDPDWRLGLDVDGNPANGTVHTFPFSATFELKTFTQNITQL